MITVKARINLTGDSNGKITSVTNTLAGNNVSGSVGDVLNKRSTPLKKPFILGRSILGKGDTYIDKLPYYMGGFLAGSNGEFSQTYEITVQGENLSVIIIVFDTENGRHPNSVVVDGVTVYDDDPQFQIPLNGETGTHTIKISNWNTPNEPLIITGIYADINIDIDETNLVSFRSNIMDRTDGKYPSYGIISNGASLDIADFNVDIIDYITQKVLHSGISVRVWIDNDTANVQEQVCEMEIREISYDNNNKQVEFTLKDNLEGWQDINVEPINFDPTKSTSQTAEWYYNYLYEKTISAGAYDMLSFSELDSETQSVLSGTTIRYPLLESSNLWDEWNKLCQLCLLHIYIDNNKRVVTKHII